MRACVRWVDRALRQHLGIVEFSQQPECVLRVSPARADLRVALPDGTVVTPGDALLELHLWNERLHDADALASLARGPHLRSRLIRSLEALARHLPQTEGGREVRACHALFRFRLGDRRSAFVRVVRGIGFTVEPDPPPSITRLAAEHGYVLALQWTFNPSVIHQDARRFERLHLWMSRHTLLTRYGAPISAPSSAPLHASCPRPPCRPSSPTARC